MKEQASILLVEDDKHDQFFFIYALKEIKNASLYDIAGNGREALDKLKDLDALPDLIFTDINMPVMTGIECISEIVSNPRTKHIPVIVLSTDKKKIPIVRALGAKAFIEKPTDCYVLRTHIEQVIGIYFVAHSIGPEVFRTFLS